MVLAWGEVTILFLWHQVLLLGLMSRTDGRAVKERPGFLCPYSTGRKAGIAAQWREERGLIRCLWLTERVDLDTRES